MNDFDKSVIVAYQNGRPIGFIKSVSYKSQSFVLTQNKVEAKKYVSVDRIHKEIDDLTIMPMALQNGIVFMYN